MLVYVFVYLLSLSEKFPISALRQKGRHPQKCHRNPDRLSSYCLRNLPKYAKNRCFNVWKIRKLTHLELTSRF